MILLKAVAGKCSVWLFAALFFFAYLLPNHPSPWQNFFHESLVAVALLLVTIHLALHAAFSAPLAKPFSLYLPTLVILLVASIPILQYGLGVVYFLGDAVLPSLYLLGAALCFALGSSLPKATVERAYRVFFAIFLALGLVNGFLALYQYFQLGYLGVWVLNVQPGGELIANLAQQNHLASVLVLACLALWFWFEKRCLSRPVFYGVLAFFIAALVLVESRTTIVVSVVLCFWYFLNVQRIPFRVRWYDWLYMASVVGVVLFALQLGASEVGASEGLESGLNPVATTDHEPMVNPRLPLWYELLQAIWQGPLWGYGWGQVAVAQALVDSPIDNVIYASYSHNALLDLLIWNGPILGALLIALIAYWGVRRALSCASVEHWLALALIAALLIHGLLEFPLAYTYFLFPVFFMAGLVDPIHQSKPLLRIHTLWLWPLVALGVLTMVVLFRDYQRVSTEYRAMVFENARFVGTQQVIGKAPETLLLTQMREYIRFERTPPTPDMTAQDLEWMRKVSHRYPRPLSLFRYAKAAYLNGQSQEFQRVMGVVARLHGKDRALAYEQAIIRDAKP